MKQPKIGAHVSAAGGLMKLIERADALGVEVVQLHPSAPQSYRQPTIEDEAAERFREMTAQREWPVMFHSIYLINLASEDDRLWHASLSSVISYLKLSPVLGALGTVTHTGSHKGKGIAAVAERLKKAAQKMAEGIGDDPAGLFIVENTAGGGGTLGRDIEELSFLFHTFNEYLPTAICLDSCHLFAAGVDLRDPEQWDAYLTEFEQKIGLSNVAAVHLNDSQTACGSKRDRHANLGEGEIGAEALARVVKDSRLTHAHFVLEVPGEGKGPDLPNISLAQSWRH